MAARLRRRYRLLLVLAVTAAGVLWIWQSTRPVDTTPPAAELAEVVPDKPLLDEGQQQVTFVLRDDQDRIPILFLFESPDQQFTATAVNTLRGTPDERGVEIRFEAVRFRRDAEDPDRLWVRAVGIANESEGKTPVSLAQIESGDPLDLHFHDEIEVPFVAHVVYEIQMTIQYSAKSQQLALTQAKGSIRWKMLASDAFDEGQIESVLIGRKGEYAEKPLLDL